MVAGGVKEEAENEVVSEEKKEPKNTTDLSEIPAFLSVLRGVDEIVKVD